MDIYLDSANYEKIAEYVEAYNIKGVTSNPSIIVKDKTDIMKLIEVVPKNKQLFVQVISDDVEGIISETKKLMSLSKNIIVKIPASSNGLKAIKKLSDESIKTLATGIYSVEQALLAANCGAAYVAPYVNRICDLEIDGVKAALEIQKAFKLNNIDCKVIAASFKNLMQVKELLINGIDAVTISADLMEKLIYNKNTAYDVKDFETAWKDYTGNDTLGL